MRRARSICIGLAAASCCIPFSNQRAKAQTPAATTAAEATIPRYRYRVIGLFDERTGSPIADADVIDVMSGNIVRTTTTGTASLLFLPDGGGLVRVRKIGYELQTMMVTITPADTNPITLVLRRAVELPAVATIDSSPHYLAPQLRAFEDRRLHSAAGYFMSEAQIRKEGDRPLGSVMVARFPGVRTLSGPQGHIYLMRAAQCSVGGPPDVYLDGVALAHIVPPPAAGRSPDNPRSGGVPIGAAPPGPTSGGTRPSQPIDLSLFQLEDLAGIEYYPSTSMAPAEYGGTSTQCGVLLLWTRQ